MDRQGKLTLTAIFSIAVVITTSAKLFYEKEASASLNQLMADERYSISYSYVDLKNKIQGITEDLNFLTKTSSIINAGINPSPENFDFVEKNFVAYARSKRKFDQVRWLDTIGLEKVRINFNNNVAEIVPKEKLQNKSDRYYFKDSIKLEKDQYYISPMDLNIENGQIEKPFKPTLRFGQKIYLPNGSSSGIVVLNYNCSSLLEGFTNTLGKSKDRAYLLNNDGYWIYSPNKSDEWGFMFQKQTTFQKKHPIPWERFQATNNGQIQYENEIWTWTKIYPALIDSTSPAQESAATAVSGNANYYWIITSFLDKNTIDSQLRPIRNKIISTALISFLLTCGLAWILLRTHFIQKNAEAALKKKTALENEERFNLLIQSSPNGLLLISKEGKILRANQQALAMFQYEENELIGNSVDMLVPENVFQRHAQNRNSYIRNPSARKLGLGKDLSARRKSGHNFFSEISLTPLTIEGELFVLACVIDVTERKAAEIIQSRLAAIVEGSEDAILSKSLDGIITSWNKGAENLFGYAADEIIGQSVLILYPPEEREQEQEIIKIIHRGETVKHFDTKRVRKDGSLFEASVSISPIQDNNKIIGASAIIRNISEQKRTQELINQLNETLEKQVQERTQQLDRALRDLQNILDALPSMVGYWDKNLFNRFANRAYSDWFGLDPSKIPGKHIRDIIGEERYQLNYEYMQAALSGIPQTFERAITSPDGNHTRHSFAHYIPDIHNNEVLGFYVLVHDITKIKQTEAALRAANQELEAFAYAVSHDLRAPLRAMIGFSQALREDCAQQLSEEGIDYLHEIEKAARKMGELIDGLLTLSRSTKGEIEHSKIDLSELATKINQELENTEQAQRKIQCSIEPGLITYGDERMLEIVLQNLFSNAVKYCAKTEDPIVKFYSEIIDGTKHFCIEDNGAGFDMTHIDRLFKPFQRLHRQDEFKGIGIGLATVQRIIKRHGGNISAYSKPGQGAKFCFSLGTHDMAKEN